MRHVNDGHLEDIARRRQCLDQTRQERQLDSGRAHKSRSDMLGLATNFIFSKQRQAIPAMKAENKTLPGDMQPQRRELLAREAVHHE
jgi:hypothetical protein